MFRNKNFYLGTPLNRFEYALVSFNKIPQEFINEYNLAYENGDGYIYFEIRNGCYGLPQSGKLANDLL